MFFDSARLILDVDFSGLNSIMRHVYENDRLLPEKFVYFVTPEKPVKHSVFGPSVVIRRIHKLYKDAFSVLNIRIHHL